MNGDPTIERSCDVCGSAFMVPNAELQFRRERGLEVPATCPECRSRLRAARNAELVAVDRRGDSFSGRDPVQPPRPGRGGSRRGPHRSHLSGQRYSTICADCGAETQVPFIPRGDRPVYCRDCFNARQGR